MTTDSRGPSSLRDAYVATTYVAHDRDSEFRIRIGARCNELDTMLEQRKISTWAFITACNPGSKLMAREQNEAAMALFRNDVVAAGFRFLEGEGVPDALHGAGWLPEPSLLILDIARDAAMKLAGKYGQRAIVAGALHQPAELVMLD